MRVKVLQSKTNLRIKRRWLEAWSNTRLLDAPSHVPFVIQLLQMNANDVFPLRVLLQVLQPCEIDSNIIKQHRAILCVGRKSLHAAYTPQVALHPSVHTSHCNLATYWTMAPDERSNFFLHEKNIQLKPDTSWHLSNWVYPGNPFVGLVRSHSHESSRRENTVKIHRKIQLSSFPLRPPLAWYHPACPRHRRFPLRLWKSWCPRCSKQVRLTAIKSPIPLSKFMLHLGLGGICVAFAAEKLCPMFLWDPAVKAPWLRHWELALKYSKL